MAIPSSADTVIHDLNVIISALIAERDRISTLTKPTLPGGVSIWAAVAIGVRQDVITDATGNCTDAATTLQSVIENLAAL